MTRNEFEKRFIAARQAAIKLDFSHLNDMQQKAVLATEGPLLILAGAGSGKTTVLINRVANLLRYGRGSDTAEVPASYDQEELDFLESYIRNPTPENAGRARALCAVEPAEPWRVIAITFTNKAAGELKTRLAAMLGEAAQDIWAMTFHSACVRILRREIERLGFSRSFTIYDTSDSVSLMKRVLKDLNIDEKSFPPKTVLGHISRAKDAMQSPEDFAAAAEKSFDIRKKHIARAYAEYARRLKEANALDFDDIIFYTVRLLLSDAEVCAYYQRKFRYVLIDEYQDTNNLQYLLASTLAGGHGNICVVGDDDQSIYKFRGATIENILSFENQYKNARVIRLEQNYRSTGHILNASNAVIRHNTGRKGKELWTDHGNGEKLTLYIAENENAEAQYVAGKILAGFSAGDPWSSHAVLYRMNAQSNQLEFAFKRNGIPYKVFGGMRFFDRAEIKDMLAYLCAAANPSDDLRLTRIINTPPRGIGAKTVETAQAAAAEEDRSLYEICKNAARYPELAKAAPKLKKFTDLIDTLQELSASVPLDEFYDRMTELTGYAAMLQANATDENIARSENVAELKTNIAAYIKSAEQPTLAGFLEEIALYTDLDSYDQDGDCVVLMTIHSAKGLEFPTVFLVGADDGLFPGTRAIGEPEEMEEERRLCYVAMTRAKQKLYITSTRRRMIFGRTSPSTLSRFVDEIPDSDIERNDPRQAHLAGGADWHSGWSASGGSGYGSSGYGSSGYSGYGSYGRVSDSRSAGRTDGSSSARSAYGSRRTPPPKAAPAAAPAAVSLDYKTGDSVRHTAFGEGVITKMTPMAGGDALIEVTFEKVGLKRLMLKTAARNMAKL